ncbi:MAG TPA: hypothetical protein VFH92_04985, partial [Phenylobacterium sp.]|nr:hypothetical protein [Phenylobacterium sp.]
MIRPLAAAALVGALAAPGSAGEIPKAVVVLERLSAPPPGGAPEGIPPRFVLLEDGQVFVSGSSQVLTAKLDGGELKALERRIAEARKLPGLAGTVTLGPGDMQHRLLLRRGRPIQMTITGDPAQSPLALKPLGDLLVDLPRFDAPGLKPYAPGSYAMSAREGALPGGCRPWPFPDPPDRLTFAPRVIGAAEVRGWPTGSTPASVC